MKRVLVTGTTGMLGESIVKEFKNDNQIALFGLSRTESGLLEEENQFLVDLLDDRLESTLTRSIDDGFDAVIHTAACTDLAFCEQNPEVAWRMHITSSGNLAKHFANSRFLYISTDSVFDGTKGDYTESDLPNPLNQYARTKYQGELEVQRRSSDAVVIRTNMYGSKSGTDNGLATWAVSSLMKGSVINGYDNVRFNPLYTRQIARILRILINEKPDFQGIINLASEETVTKYAYIKMLAEQFGLNMNNVKRAEMPEFGGQLRRPLNTTLNTSKAKALFGMGFHLVDGIDEFFKNYRAGL